MAPAAPPTAHTGLASRDVFYFGSLVGETGDPVPGAVPAAWRVARPLTATLRTGAARGAHMSCSVGRLAIRALFPTALSAPRV